MIKINNHFIKLKMEKVVSMPVTPISEQDIENLKAQFTNALNLNKNESDQLSELVDVFKSHKTCAQ